VLISVEETGKNQGEPGQESVGDAAVLSHSSLLRNPWPKLTGVLEHCHEGENNCWFSIFGGRFLLTTSLRWQGCQCHLMRQEFPSCCNSCNLYQQILGTFWNYYIYFLWYFNTTKTVDVRSGPIDLYCIFLCWHAWR